MLFDCRPYPVIFLSPPPSNPKTNPLQIIQLECVSPGIPIALSVCMNTTPTKQIFDFIQEVRELSFCATEGAMRVDALQVRIDAIASAIATTSHLHTVYQEKSKNIEDSLEQVAAVLR